MELELGLGFGVGGLEYMRYDYGYCLGGNSCCFVSIDVSAGASVVGFVGQ